MQIDKLFDELDARALDEVLTLPVRGTAEVSARRIRRRVNRTLDADPAAHRTHRMQLCRRAVCAAVCCAGNPCGAAGFQSTSLELTSFATSRGSLTMRRS